MMDRSFVERNRAATERMRAMAASLSDDALERPLGEHWTIATAFAHLAFWDGSVIAILDAGKRDGKISPINVGVIVNDISLPIWLAVPPREAANLAIAIAEKLDQQLEMLSPEMLAQVAANNPDDVEP